MFEGCPTLRPVAVSAPLLFAALEVAREYDGISPFCGVNVYTYRTKTRKNAKEIERITTPTTDDFTAILLKFILNSPPSAIAPLPPKASLYDAKSWSPAKITPEMVIETTMNIITVFSYL